MGQDLFNKVLWVYVNNRKGKLQVGKVRGLKRILLLGWSQTIRGLPGFESWTIVSSTKFDGRNFAALWFIEIHSTSLERRILMKTFFLDSNKSSHLFFCHKCQISPLLHNSILIFGLILWQFESYWKWFSPSLTEVLIFLLHFSFLCVDL